MQITEIDPFDDDALRAWHATYLAGETFGRPYATPWMLEETRAAAQAAPVAERKVLSSGTVAGQVVSTALTSIPLKDNLTTAEILVYTHPDHRRRGYGSLMLQHAEELAARHGRTVLGSMTDFAYEAAPDGSGQPGVEFLRTHGYGLALVDVQRAVRLPIPEDLLDRLAAEAAPRHEGYRLRQFENRCPDDIVASYGRLLGSLITEAPSGERVVEDELFDEERIRQDEAVRAAAGRDSVVTVALDPFDEAVAYSEIVVSGHHSGRAYQWGTLVAPEHRGHRLGMAVKVANHRLLQRRHPGVRDVVTYNAEVNDRMIAVNELLGFRPTARSAEFQKTVSS